MRSCRCKIWGDGEWHWTTGWYHGPVSESKVLIEHERDGLYHLQSVPLEYVTFDEPPGRLDRTTSTPMRRIHP